MHYFFSVRSSIILDTWAVSIIFWFYKTLSQSSNNHELSTCSLTIGTKVHCMFIQWGFLYRMFSVVQIHGNKTGEGVYIPQDWFPPPIWLPLFIVLEHQYGCHDVMWKKFQSQLNSNTSFYLQNQHVSMNHVCFNFLMHCMNDTIWLNLLTVIRYF